MINKKYSYRELRKDLKRIGVRISHRKYLSHMTFIDCDQIVIKTVIDAIKNQTMSYNIKLFSIPRECARDYYIVKDTLKDTLMK